MFLLVAAPAQAQQFPALTGRVVDAAELLSPADEAALTAKLEALEQASTRQLVVATVPSLEDREIEEYGYLLGRSWKIGQAEANNGAILLVAPNEKKVRIEVGYGLEGILTDALSSLIIQNQILPRFREGDFPGGINAGTDAIIEQLQAPPEVAEQKVVEAAARQGARREGSGGGSIFPLIFWGAIFVFVILPLIFRRRSRRGPWGGRRYGGSDWPIILWSIANAAAQSSGGRSRGGSGGFGGFGGGGRGFGGFSGGGGSFGGGGASGGW